MPTICMYSSSSGPLLKSPITIVSSGMYGDAPPLPQSRSAICRVSIGSRRASLPVQTLPLACALRWNSGPWPTCISRLQTDNVGITHGLCDAPNINSLVERESQTNIVDNELHLVLRQDVFRARQALLGRAAVQAIRKVCVARYADGAPVSEESGDPFRTGASPPELRRLTLHRAPALPPAARAPTQDRREFTWIGLHGIACRLVAHVYEVVADGV